MTEQEILDGNKLIAKFMETEFAYDSFYISKYGHAQLSDGIYHLSWDWLMDIVEKINNTTFSNTTQFDVVISKTGCCITQYFYGGEHQKWQTGLYNKLSLIESVWTCVVNFIVWFNKVDKTNLNDSRKSN